MKPGEHRLLYVAGQLGGGGLERQLWYLLSTMDRNALRPGVVVWDYDPEAVYARRLRSLDVPVYPIERAGGFALRLARLRRTVRALRPEVLHSYSFPTNFPAWWALRGLPGIAVGSLRNEYRAERESMGRIGGALCSRFPPFLIANSECARRAAEAHRGWTAPRKVVCVPNGFDLSRSRVEPLPGGGRFEIVGIGRLSPQKNWQETLAALAKLKAHGVGPWRFRLCGAGPLADDLRRRCRELGLEAQVEFLGFCDDVPSMLASSHVLVLTSTFEGTPNVVMEAMAAGRPVAATAVGDVPRLIRDDREGYVVPPGGVDAMAERLARLARDPALAARMGRAGRERAEADLSLCGLLEKTLAAYRQAGWQG